jgi:hypothetical protein
MSSSADGKIAGLGRKRPQLNIEIERLHLDSENPRLPEESQKKDEKQLLRILYEQFSIDELAQSMSKNGYFDEEPLIATPLGLPKDLRKQSSTKANSQYKAFIENKKTEFMVVEGNRRLATAILLLDPKARKETRVASDFPEISREVADDLSILPVIVYPHRDEVVPYLGVRHIIGIEKWDPYAKARYLAKMIESGMTVEQVQAQIGDTQNAVLKSYVCYRLLEQAKDELDFNTKNAKNDFSLLMVALSQRGIKQFLNLPTKLSRVNFTSPVMEDRLKNLEEVLVYVFGDGRRQRVINDSRQISMLGHVLADTEATVYLRQSHSLFEAYERTDGEEQMVLKYLGEANRKMETVIGIAHRHRTDEVIEKAQVCAETSNALLKAVSKQDG